MSATYDDTVAFSRRVFLLSSGALAIALTLPDDADAASNGAKTKPSLTPDQLDS